jgi:hypothetical protein
MEIKVREVKFDEPKSVQEIERELVEQHEQSLQQQDDPQIMMNETPKEVELREEDVLSYIGKRYNKQINSFDELMSERNSSEV